MPRSLVFVALLSGMMLAAPAANAVYYDGSEKPLCGYMDPTGPQDHWDLNDAPQYRADFAPYLEGSSAAELAYAVSSVSCTKSWASITFGSDTVSGPGFKVSLTGHSSGNGGVEDDAVCTIYHGSTAFPWIAYSLHLRH